MRASYKNQGILTESMESIVDFVLSLEKDLKEGDKIKVQLSNKEQEKWFIEAFEAEIWQALFERSQLLFYTETIDSKSFYLVMEGNSHEEG